MHWIQTISAPSLAIGGKYTQCYGTAVRNCKNIKQGSTTHSSYRQSNLQRKNEAALMSCRIRAVEHRVSGDGLAGANPGLKNRILLNYTRIENAHKVCKKTFDFVVIYGSPANFSLPFFLLRHNKCLNASLLTTAVFELVQQF